MSGESVAIVLLALGSLALVRASWLNHKDIECLKIKLLTRETAEIHDLLLRYPTFKKGNPNDS